MKNNLKKQSFNVVMLLPHADALTAANLQNVRCERWLLYFTTRYQNMENALHQSY